MHNSVTDRNLGRLMRIAIEGPELSTVNFNEVLDIFKKKKKKKKKNFALNYHGGGGGGGNSRVPPLYEALPVIGTLNGKF